MKTVAIIQARMGSTRLPGKVMKMLQDKTVLSHVITRVKACPRLDEVVVATTDLAADDVIVEESEMYGVPCFRGSEQDVLSRYYHAAREQHADVIVRVTSDCPLFDPEVLTAMLDDFFARQRKGEALDYLSNTLKRSYPRGLDAEIMTFAALKRAYKEATKPFEREHVTPYIYLHPEIFYLASFKQEEDLSFYRWTLDSEEDFKFIKAVYTALSLKYEQFSTDEVLALLDKRPDLIEINA